MPSPLRSLSPGQKAALLRASRVLVLVALGAPALVHLSLVLRIFWAQVPFPMDLEWMEGGQLYHAVRFAEGQPVYGPPSQGFVPYPYPPLHFTLLALVGQLAGFDYGPARLLSVACFCLAAAVLAHQVAAHAGERWSGLGAALLALGTIAATMPTVTGWYALIRNDALAIALPIAAAALAARAGEAPLSRVRIGGLAVLLVASILAKQTGMFFVVWIGAYVLLRQWRAGLLLAGVTAALGLACLLVLQLSTDGWFLRYVLAPGRHPIIERRVPLGLWEMAGSAPHLALAPLAAAFLLGRRALRPRTVLWLGMLVAAVPATLLPYAKVGGTPNNWIPLLLLAGPTALLLALDLARLFTRPWQAQLARLALGAAMAWILVRGTYDPRPFIPTAAALRSAQQLNAWVASLPGEVLALSHPILAVRNGKRTEQLHAYAVRDALDGGLHGFGLHELLARTRPPHVLLDDEPMERSVVEAVLRSYEPAGPVPYRVPMLIATQVSPHTLYRRKPEPRQVRRLHDFETDFAGWSLQGDAFAQGPTTDHRPCQGLIVGLEGRRLANSFTCERRDASVGTALSPPFTIDRRWLGFLVGGGAKARVELRIDGKVVRSASGRNTELLRWEEWDLGAEAGQRAQLAIVDEDREGWGHILVDDVTLFDR